MIAGSAVIRSLHKTFSATITEAARWRARLIHQSQRAGTVWLQSNGKEFNLLAPELFFFLILAHPVYKMWIIQEPNTLELWNKLHFEEEKTESINHV